jgi:hypothetical protein
MRVIEGAADRPLLSLDDVAATHRPATFSGFGDHLLYIEGTVYALPRRPEPPDLAQPMSLPGAYVVTQTVGIEFGWQHLNECTCDLCMEGPQRAAA